MADTHEALLKAVRQYQESLEKYTRHRNDGKLLNYMDKLYKLPIRLVHLEETGVGRTVNGLRKMGREVGDASKALVAKWKEMVMSEQRLRSEQEDGYGSGNDQDASEPSDSDPEDDEVEAEVVDPTQCDSPSRNESDNEQSTSSVHTNRHSSPHSKKDKYKHHRSSSGEASGSKSKAVTKRKVEDSESEEDEPQHKKRPKIEDSSDDEIEEVSKKQKRKIESDDDEEERVIREKKRSSMELERKEHKSKRKSESHSHRSSKGSKEKSKSDRKDKEKDTKHKSEEKKEDSRKHGHSSEKKTKKSTTSNSSKSSKEEQKKGDSKKEKPDEKTPKPKRDSYVKPQGIDSGSGASFAEALGMCEPSSSKTQKKKPTQSERKEKTSKIEDLLIPDTLKESPPEPLDINIASLLPSITPHYRPLGNLISEEVHLKRPLTDYEQLSNIITSKNQRTKVYSGNKVGCGKVSSLFELCIRVLQDNIDALEYTGGVPYLVLKPILEKSTPNQLFLLEHHNPYLIEDTDELWQLHTQKEFRNKKREELESWREMYMRCLDEREAKLKALTANIKQSQDKSLPVRTTKLAYVDDVAKPPRNIARKQAKNGTAFDKKPAITPSARLSSLATSGEAGKVAVPNPGARAAERSHSHIAKPKKAPLMAKSLSLLKNRFKR